MQEDCQGCLLGHGRAEGGLRLLVVVGHVVWLLLGRGWHVMLLRHHLLLIMAPLRASRLVLQQQAPLLTVTLAVKYPK